jgi:hypothetical protein
MIALTRLDLNVVTMEDNILRAKLKPSGQRADCVESARVIFAAISANPGFEL